MVRMMWLLEEVRVTKFTKEEVAFKKE